MFTATAEEKEKLRRYNMGGIKAESLALLNKITEIYNANTVNRPPDDARTLYQYYRKYTVDLLKFFREEIDDLPYVINNEIRAMFGHLAKHSLKFDLGNTELIKAYGHFRRLNLDIFKILCDEFDKSFNHFLRKAHKYNYKKISKDFLLKYSNMYICARDAYLKAQFSESVGSNNDANVYQAYFEAFCLYVKLITFHYENKKQINKVRYCTRLSNILSTGWSLGMILLSAITLIP